ncbi:hypothetical protein AUK22_02360, partial [bacterium CG2_30_54_10]
MLEKNWSLRWAAGCLLALLFTIGCTLVNPFRSLPDQPSVSTQVERPISAASGLDFRSDLLRVYIPPDAIQADAVLVADHYPFPQMVASLPRGFLARSEFFTFRFVPEQERLLSPVRLELPVFSPRGNEATGGTGPLFVACQKSRGNWLLITPALDSGNTKAIVETLHLSDWIVIQQRIASGTGTGAGTGRGMVPETGSGTASGTWLETISALVASPTILKISDRGFVEGDLLVESGITLASGTRTTGGAGEDFLRWRQELKLFPIPAFPMKVSSLDGSSGKMSRQLSEDHSVLFDPTTDPLMGRAFSNWSASYTLRINLSGLSVSQAPKRLGWRFSAWTDGGFRFEREGQIDLAMSSKSADPANLPRVVSTVPRDQEVGVSVRQELEIRFDRDMEPISVYKSFSMDPSPGSITWQWIDSQTVLAGFPSFLEPGRVYTASLATSATDIRGFPLDQPYRWVFTTMLGSDLVPPVLVRVTPPNGAKKFPRNGRIDLLFSEAMNKSSVEGSVKFTSPDVGTLSWYWAPGADSVSFLPARLWDEMVQYRVSIGTECRDLEGNPLGNRVNTSFTTGPSGPEIVETVPAMGSRVKLPLNKFEFLFDRAMDRPSVEGAFSMFPAVIPVFSWNTEETKFIVSWTDALLPTAAEIVASFSALARDKKTNALGGTTVFRFPVSDTTPPVVLEFTPASETLGTPINSGIFLKFSEAMNRLSVESAIQTSPSPSGAVFQWNAAGDSVWLFPGSDWPKETLVTVSLSTTARDLGGNSIALPLVFSFTTKSTPAPSIAGSIPTAGQTGVSRTATLTLQFSEPMDKAGVESVLSFSPSLSKGAVFSWLNDDRTLEIRPIASLPNQKNMILSIDATAKGRSGASLAKPVSIPFSTADTEPPVLIGTTPRDGQTGVDPSAALVFKFDEPIERLAAEKAVSLSPAPGASGKFTWSADSRSFTLAWDAPLAGNTSYTCALATSLADISGNHAALTWEIGFKTRDTTPPAVSGTIPADQATGQPLFTAVLVNFSKPMATRSVNLTFQPAVSGTAVRKWNTTATALTEYFSQQFTSSTHYQVTIDPGATDSFGNPLAGSLTLGFTTGTAVNPRVVGSTPANGTLIATLTPKFEVTFDRAMDAQSVALAFSITPAIPQGQNFAWDADQKIVKVTFSTQLQSGTAYSVKLSTAAADLAGVHIPVEFSADFVTEAAPTIVTAQVVPPNGAVSVTTGTAIRIPFSKAMESGSTERAFSLLLEGMPIAGTFSWSGNTMVFQPAKPLSLKRSYYFILVTTGARDIHDLPLKTAFTGQFMTVPGAAPEIISAAPADGSNNVTFDSAIVLNFNQSMDSATVNPIVFPAPPGNTLQTWTN